MTAIDVAGPAAAAVPPSALAAPAPALGIARFVGSGRAFFRLVAHGAVLLMFTLGIYRFWLTTDVRRFLWGHIEVAGDGLEYTGTARELLIGFLMAIVLLVPINALIFIGTLAPSLLPYSGTLGFILLALLGQYAFFRARRYRLTRTVYRGVRFHQGGSAVSYSVRSNLWMALIVLTAGLAYPWAQASLERYKMRHTYFGDLQGRFAGSGTGLFLRGILLWLVVFGPFLAALYLALAMLDWAALATALTTPGGPPWSRLGNTNPEFVGAVGLAIAGIAWAALGALLLYPVFRAIVTRWWISGLQVGGVTATSRLRTGQVYSAYLAFFGWSMLFGLALSIAAVIGAGAFYVAARALPQTPALEIAGIVLGLGAYVILMLGVSAIYQSTVTLRMWRLSFEMTELAGLEALDHVQARGEASGVFGEGLADALDVGGM